MQLWSKEEGGITRLVTSCVIKHVIEGKIDGSDGKTRKDVSGYWITLMKRGDAGN